MIRINTAKSVSNMAYVGTYGLGPFSPDGGDLFEVTSIRSSYDVLKERPGIYGENHVNHRMLNATVYIDPTHGNFPDPLAQLNLYAKTSSGGWSTSYAPLYAYHMAPARPWIRTSVTYGSPVFFRKLSPTCTQIHSQEWEFNTLTRRYRLNNARLTQYTCDVPEKGATSVKVTMNEWALNYRDPSAPSILSYTPESCLQVVDETMAATLRGKHAFINYVSSIKFPFFYRGNFVENVVSPRQVLLKMQWITEDRYLFPEDIKSHGTLASEAIETLDTNSINMFEFLQGFKRPQDLVPKLKNLSKLKTHAGNYLGVQYGILPTISDLETLKEAIMGSARPYFDSNNYQVLTAGHNVSRFSDGARVEHTNRVKITVNPTDPALSTLSEKLRDIGGFPSINNLWELVPYSFVIDWFVNVGDMLESIDTRYRMSTLPIMYSTTSSKIVITPSRIESLTAMGVSGEISIVLYDRSVSPDAPKPPLSFEASNKLPSHWLEAGALIVTARK